MTQVQPVYDKQQQFDKIVAGLLAGDHLIAVYDAIGAGTGFIAVTKPAGDPAEQQLPGQTHIPVRRPLGQAVRIVAGAAVARAEQFRCSHGRSRLPDLTVALDGDAREVVRGGSRCAGVDPANESLSALPPVEPGGPLT